jgi:hypothetical protein
MKTETVSKRILVTLPDTLHDDVEGWADYQGRPTANLASYLIEVGVREAKSRGEFRIKDKKLSSDLVYKTVAELVRKNLDALIEYNRIDRSRLDALIKGDRPTDLEMARIALALGLDESYVEQLAAKIMETP